MHNGGKKPQELVVQQDQDTRWSNKTAMQK